jgi:hypothetical protein
VRGNSIPGRGSSRRSRHTRRDRGSERIFVEAHLVMGQRSFAFVGRKCFSGDVCISGPGRVFGCIAIHGRTLPGFSDLPSVTLSGRTPFTSHAYVIGGAPPRVARSRHFNLPTTWGSPPSARRDPFGRACAKETLNMYVYWWPGRYLER